MTTVDWTSFSKSLFCAPPPAGVHAAVSGPELRGSAPGSAEVLQPVAERRPESAGG